MRPHNGRASWKPMLPSSGRRARRDGIYGEAELRNLIVYERARADRTGANLSLVLCGLRELHGSRRDISRTIQSLSTSIRTTDHLGWYSSHELGVVLPLTSREGAVKFVEGLRSSAQGADWNLAQKLSFTVHSYPDKWLEERDEETEQSGNPAGKDSATYFTTPVPRWKRTLDVVGASLGLVALSPLLGIVGLYIKIVSPGPVLFKQKRVGLARREFTFYKFRTMHHRNNEEVHSHHAKDFIYFDKPMTKLDGIDPRIIKGGRILRKLAIDELPQLLNIIKGDMSLVGPRPCIPYEAEEYLQWHTDRFSILPGLTGLWQVSGKNKLTFQQMIRLDIEYSRKMSLWFDLLIILRTFPTVIQLGIEGTSRRIKLMQEKQAAQKELAVGEPVESDRPFELVRRDPSHQAAAE